MEGGRLVDLSDTMYHKFILEIQLPHKIVDLIFQLGIVNKKLKNVWGSCLHKTNQ